MNTLFNCVYKDNNNTQLIYHNYIINISTGMLKTKCSPVQVFNYCSEIHLNTYLSEHFIKKNLKQKKI